MTIAEIDEKISINESDVITINSNLDTMKKELMAESYDFLIVEINQEIERIVKEKSEHTLELGQEKLYAFKADIKQTIESINSIYFSNFEKENVCDHINYKLDNLCLNKNHLQEGIRRKLQYAIKDTFQEIGRLLIKYGYVGLSNWTNNYPNNDMICFRGELQLLPNINVSIRLYSDEYEKLYNKLRSIENLKKEKLEEQAVELFHQS